MSSTHRLPGCPPRGLSFLVVRLAVATAACGGPGVTEPDADTGPKEGPPVEWISVTVGMGAWTDYACGVTAPGSLYCWGDFPGRGPFTPGRSPTRVPLPVPVAHVEAGWHHACALTADGKALCWGNSSLSEPASGPTFVFPDRSFRALSAGNFFTCGIDAAGELICWTGTINPQTTLSMRGVSFSDVSAGSNYACAVTAEGAGYCWGYNTAGRLGDGTKTDRTEPVRVSGDLEFRSITGQAYHTCGLTQDGAAYCWGSVVDYQSGPPVARGPVPQPVGGDIRFTSLSSGYEFTCGIAEGGQAHCWGTNNQGELGTATGGAGSNTPVPVSGGFRFKILKAGGSNACGISTAGQAYCWGSDSDGQLGIGSVAGPNRYSQFRNSPTRVLNPLP